MAKRPFTPFAHPIPKAFDPAHLLEGFETFEQVLERRNRIIRILMLGNRQHRRLARKLRKCRKGHRCLSYACPVCIRRFRRWLGSQQLQFWKSFSDQRLSHITSILAKDQYDLGSLHELVPGNLVKAYARRLKRAGLKDCAVVGAIDFDLIVLENDTANANWQPHFHIIAADVPLKGYQTLKARIKQCPEKMVRRPNKKVSIKDRIKQLTYVLKPFHQRKSFYRDDEDRLTSKKYPLKPAELRELLCLLDRYALTEFLVLQNIRQRGKKLVPGHQFVDVNSKSTSSKKHQIGP